MTRYIVYVVNETTGESQFVTVNSDEGFRDAALAAAETPSDLWRTP